MKILGLVSPLLLLRLLCFITGGLWGLVVRAEGARTPIHVGYISGSQRDPTIRESYNVPGQQISGAVMLAIDEINNDSSLLPDHRLVLYPKETFGDESYSIRAVNELRYQNVSVIIGPQETCKFEARLADVYDIPMISYYCNDAVVSDKSLYSTFARTRPRASLIARSLLSLLQTYNWSRVTLVYKQDDESMQKTAEAFLTRAKQVGLNITSVEVFRETSFYDGSDASNAVYLDIVRRTYVETRIYVLITNRYEFVGFAAAMKSRGLMDNGDYFLVCVDGESRNFGKILTGLWMHEPPPSHIVDAFQSVLVVVPSPPKRTDFQKFGVLVNKYLEKPPFNFTTNLSQLGVLKDILPEAAYLYDAMMLYARAARRAITNGEDFSRGHVIMKYLRGEEYTSATGLGNRLDDNGDSEGNYTILYRSRQDPNAQWRMTPIGTFHKASNATLVVSFYGDESVDWVAGSPPLSIPRCGFYGEKCTSNTWKIVVGILGCLLAIVLIIGAIIYRNWKYEQDLAKMLWRVEWKDVVTKNSHQFNVLIRETSPAKENNGLLPPSLRASQTSLESTSGDLEYRHVYTSVGCHKGTLVAIKYIRKKAVDLTRPVQKELKLLKDVRHVNLTQFYGACIDHPIAILTEYCPKGSLQDVLENDDVKLDQYFITSIVNDILKGLAFIHTSDFHRHGRLKSSNCLIDSRWVLKLSDYGLTYFRSGEDKSDLGEHAFYSSLFWSAPEQLHSPHNGASQKGDIYALAIVLYEIYSRCGPYGNTDASLNPKDIIERVKYSDSPQHPFRPRLAGLESTPKFVTDCISECWSEYPQDRPDIHGVRARLKPLQKGLKPNIMDNMMAVMERYATNLEGVVQERTEQLLEEKKKTEELLLQMLPRSVAEQLKLGKQVEAEAFDSVSIYFSDICGFTSLSSASTPMQVVDLLNDLYTCFDLIIGHYQCYKVETIGDAYMCVSGLPIRNGTRHAGEIASMALHLLSAIKKFRIRHMPSTTLMLRIGIHSGSCVAGVVGRKMPRYCLFGDTVNTASRMESTGEALKIHCSSQCKELLDDLGGYELEDRGLVAMKGKGEQQTYWLLGRSGKVTTPEYPPDSPIFEVNQSSLHCYHLSDVITSTKNKLNNHGSKPGDKQRTKKLSAGSPMRRLFSSDRKQSTGKSTPPAVGQVVTRQEESPLLVTMPEIRTNSIV